LRSNILISLELQNNVKKIEILKYKKIDTEIYKCLGRRRNSNSVFFGPGFGWTGLWTSKRLFE